MDEVSPPTDAPILDLADRPPATEFLEHATHGIRLRGDDLAAPAPAGAGWPGPRLQ